MPVIEPGGDIHKRFFILSGLVRHEYWLNGQRAEDYGYVADVDAMTLSARRYDDRGKACVLKVSEQDLMGDLHALARQFFAEHCRGLGLLLDRKTPTPTRSTPSS